MTHGFLRVAVATPDCAVGDCGANTAEILALAKGAAARGAALVVFPELAVTGYTCGDLFAQELLGRVALAAVRLIAEKTRDLPITLVVGFPFSRGGSRYNAAAVISDGRVVGVVPKTHLPTYGEFYELRHFAPAPTETVMLPADLISPEAVPFGANILFVDEKNPDLAFACEICEDLWVPEPPSSRHARAGAVIIANLSASDETVGKADYRRSLVASQSARTISAYLYADAGTGESSTDMVFAGHDIISENGAILAENPPFAKGLLVVDIDARRLLQERRRLNSFAPLEPESAGYRVVTVSLDRESEGARDEASYVLHRPLEAHPFVPRDERALASRCEEILAIQAAGLARRISHTGLRSVVIGLSGGLDSTLALLVSARAFDRLGLDRSGILAITMPGFGTTGKTKGNAKRLADALGVTLEEIKITKAVQQHFRDIGQDAENRDVTYENSQARERTQILMDRANMVGALVIGTGDLSELALGWATYNGDHMSMYGVNSTVPKTLVRHLVAYCADTAPAFAGAADSDAEAKAHKLALALRSVLETPVSPELLPPEDGEISQKTEDIVGPYELHDFFLYHMVRWGSSPAKILFLATRAFDAYDRSTILSWMRVFYRRFFAQQFKRSCLPDGPKVGSVTLSPRSDWRMPSDASAAIWLKELENIE